MKRNSRSRSNHSGEGKILCCQRGPERALANLWEFPGGKIENGETEVQALERELQEELK